MKRAAVTWAQENLSPEATERIKAATDAASRKVAIAEGVPEHLVHPAIGDTAPPPVPKVQLASLSEYGFRPGSELRDNPDDDDLDEESLASTMWAMELDEEHHDALQSYTGQSYGIINGALKRGSAGSLPGRYRTMMRDLDQALRTAQTAAAPRMVYRGVRVPEEWSADEIRERITEAYPVGSTADFKTYLSTSLKPSVASGFGRGAIPVMYEMKSARGANLEDMSDKPGEHEVLFGRDTRWRVVGVTTNARTVRADLDDFEETDAVIIHFVEESEAKTQSAGGAPGLAPVRKDFPHAA